MFGIPAFGQTLYTFNQMFGIPAFGQTLDKKPVYLVRH